MKIRNFLLIAAIASTLAGCDGALMTLYRAFGPDHHYVSPKDPALILAAPPAPGSPADQNDMKVLLAWQAKRSAEDCRLAKAQENAAFEEFFGEQNPLPKPMSPEAATLVFRISYDTSKIVAVIKDKYRRQRPFLRNAELKPCLGRIAEQSYPSGHSALSRVYALLLADLYPARRAEFLARADQDALYRVIGGVHHPSDIEAGKLLGSEIYAEMLKSPAFMKELATLKAQARTAEK